MRVLCSFVHKFILSEELHEKKKPSMQNVFQMSMFCLLPPSLCNMSELHEPQKNVDEKKNSIYQMCALKSKKEQKEKK